MPLQNSKNGSPTHSVPSKKLDVTLIRNAYTGRPNAYLLENAPSGVPTTVDAPLSGPISKHRESQKPASVSSNISAGTEGTETGSILPFVPTQEKSLSNSRFTPRNALEESQGALAQCTEDRRSTARTAAVEKNDAALHTFPSRKPPVPPVTSELDYSIQRYPPKSSPDSLRPKHGLAQFLNRYTLETPRESCLTPYTENNNDQFLTFPASALNVVTADKAQSGFHCNMHPADHVSPSSIEARDMERGDFTPLNTEPNSALLSVQDTPRTLQPMSETLPTSQTISPPVSLPANVEVTSSLQATEKAGKAKNQRRKQNDTLLVDSIPACAASGLSGKETLSNATASAIPIPEEQRHVSPSTKNRRKSSSHFQRDENRERDSSRKKRLSLQDHKKRHADNKGEKSSNGPHDLSTSKPEPRRTRGRNEECTEKGTNSNAQRNSIDYIARPTGKDMNRRQSDRGSGSYGGCRKSSWSHQPAANRMSRVPTIFDSKESAHYPDASTNAWEVHIPQEPTVKPFPFHPDVREHSRFYEAQLELYFGFIGVQIMLVFANFVFSNPAGALVLLFGCLSACYSHIDRRTSGYILTAIILLISSTVLCVAVAKDINGFRPYRDDPTLKAIATGSIPLSFIFLLHNASLAWQHRNHGSARPWSGTTTSTNP